MPKGIYKRKIKTIIREGDKYNRLTAIKFDHRNEKGEQCWLFRCSCGNEKVIRVSEVKNSHIKSCGCLVKERMTTHGMTNSSEYKIWTDIKKRCSNKNNKGFKNYGGRGITVCKRWLSFENFFVDMGKRPSSKYSIDRIDNDKGYSKENCRWATAKEQANNRRSNRLLTFDSKTQNIKQWAFEKRIRYATLYARIKKGWSTEKALTTPVR